MTDARQRIDDQELERQLVELGKHVAFPASNQLVRRVHASLLADTGSRSRTSWRDQWWGRHGRRAMLVFAACLALIALVLVVSPSARAAITSLFNIRGVEITRVSPGTPLPSPVGTKLNLGRRTTLASAQEHLRFHLELPRYKTVGLPDEVYIDGPLPGQVALVYRPRAGIPGAARTGVGLLITEFNAGLETGIIRKLAYMGTTVENVSVQGAPGLWLSGAPHFFGYTTSYGNVIVEQLRLAGNTLLWERGGVTYRLEGSVTKDTALRIAASMR